MRVREWLSRYGVAECVGIACAFAASALTRHLTRHSIAVGYAAAWGETAGYALTIAARDMRAGIQKAHRANRKWGWRAAGRLGLQLLAEFGPAGAMDTFVTRPFCMGFAVHWLGFVRGIVVGKIVADVVFYIPVVFTYERRRHAERRR